MTAGAFLAAATQRLQAANIATARLDTLVLLEDVLNTNRVHILANPDLLITPEQLKILNRAIARRERHEPLAYIRNKTEFYGRDFYVNHYVLEPRSESETIIELLKQLSFDPSTTNIVDVGAGSGALAITAKLEFPEATVYAVDIDKNCLKVVQKNGLSLAANLATLLSNLLVNVADNTLNNAILLCNLPYVPDNFQINTAATHEPRLAIYGGGDGLDLYRRLFAQLQNREVKPRYVLTEALPPQHELLTDIAKAAGFVLDQSADFIQVFRTDTGSFGLWHSLYSLVRRQASRLW